MATSATQAPVDGAVPQAAPAPPGAVDASLPPAMAERASHRARRLRHLLPVTLGNIFGGAVMVGLGLLAGVPPTNSRGG